MKGRAATPSMQLPPKTCLETRSHRLVDSPNSIAYIVVETRLSCRSFKQKTPAIMTSNAKYRVANPKTKEGVLFGTELRDTHFLFDKEFLNLNHGMASQLTPSQHIF